MGAFSKEYEDMIQSERDEMQGKINKMQTLLEMFTPDYHNCEDCHNRDCNHAGDDNPTVCQSFRAS